MISEGRVLKDNYWRQQLRDEMKIALATVVCVLVVLLQGTKPSLGQCTAPTCPSGSMPDLDNCECTTVQSATCSGTLMPSDASCTTVSSPQCSGGCSLDQSDCTCSLAGACYSGAFCNGEITFGTGADCCIIFRFGSYRLGQNGPCIRCRPGIGLP